MLISGGPAENSLLSRIEESTADTHRARTRAGLSEVIQVRGGEGRVVLRVAAFSEVVGFIKNTLIIELDGTYHRT